MQNLSQLAFQIHDILGRYLKIHDKIFKFSIRKAIPIPGIFKPIDFASCYEELSNLCSELNALLITMASVSNIELPPETYSQLLTALKQYTRSLSQPVRLLMDICNNLNKKSEGATDYSKNEYDQDVESYQTSTQEYMLLGQKLNSMLSLYGASDEQVKDEYSYEKQDLIKSTQKVVLFVHMEYGIHLLFDEEIKDSFIDSFGDKVRIVHYYSAVEAFDYLIYNDVDLIISDLKLIGTDGREFLNACKILYPTLPFIIYTAYPHHNIPKKFKSDYYIVISSDLSELLNAIKECINDKYNNKHVSSEPMAKDVNKLATLGYSYLKLKGCIEAIDTVGQVREENKISFVQEQADSKATSTQTDEVDEVVGLTPKEYLESINYEKMMICAECYEIYGFWNYRSSEPENMYYQKCGLKCKGRNLKFNFPLGEKNKEDEKWPRFDFNEVVTLCYCCGQELLSSGSRWSVWFCKECKGNVVHFNSTYQKQIIPIGRHSMMRGYKLTGQDLKDGMEEAVEEFKINVDNLFCGIDRLDEWRTLIMQENFKVLSCDGDILLNEYMIKVDRLSGKNDAFQRMRLFYAKNEME